MFHNLFDSHTHSENSPDATHSVSFMADQALMSGLQGIAITDHVDIDLFEKFQYAQRIRQSAFDVARTKAAFRNRLIITSGMEIGSVFFDPVLVEKVMSMREYDFILGAIHRIRDDLDFYDVDYDTISRYRLDSMIEQYFIEIAEFVRLGGFDVLAHLDFALRYPKLRKGIEIDLLDYREQIDVILKLLVARGIGLEINTSGLRNGFGRVMPPDWVIKRYHELGGEIMTIGSDAHDVFSVGAGIAYAMGMMKEVGYKYFAFYRNRQPVMLRII